MAHVNKSHFYLTTHIIIDQSFFQLMLDFTMNYVLLAVINPQMSWWWFQMCEGVKGGPGSADPPIPHVN